MANITNNEERYLRHILLLGKGGCLVLRALVSTEKDKDGRSLQDILKSSKTKLHKCLQKFQFNYIFPSGTVVNADIETWDISLLISIILNVFGHVTQEEKDAVNEIRNIRNKLQGHHPSYSLTEGEYNDLRLELTELILKLSCDKTTKIKCLEIISYSGAGHLTNGIVLKELNASHAFEGYQLTYFNERFGESESRLEFIGETVNEVKNKLDTVEKIDEDRHAELRGHLQRIHLSTDESKHYIEKIKGNTHTMEIYQKERQEKLLQAIDVGMHSSKQALTEIKDESSDHRQMTRDMGTVQGHMHDDVLETKSLTEKTNQITAASSKSLDLVKETVTSSREMGEQHQATLRRIEQMLTEFMPHYRGRQLQHDVDAIIDVNGERFENATEAQDIIITSINDILKEIRPDVMEDQENAEAIMQKVNELLLREEGRDYELTKALLELIKDIIRHGHVQKARKGSIKITVRFPSYSELFSFLQYLSSEQFQDRLNDISSALKNRTGHVVKLSGNIAEDSLYDLHKQLEEDCKCTRSVVLPIQCKGIVDLNHIWKLLQRGGTDVHMMRLSEILTKIVGGKVTLTTSVNLKQFEQELLKTDCFAQRIYGEGCSEGKRTDSDPDYKFRLKIERTKNYSVRYKKDRGNPIITGMEVLPDGRIFLIDYWNDRLKLYGSSYKIVSYFDLSGSPFDMCYIGNNKIAVGLGRDGILFAHASNGIVIEKSVKLRCHVSSLTLHYKTLYILDKYGTVYTATVDGHLQGCLYKTGSMSSFGYYRCIAVSDDGDRIYIACVSEGLVTIDKKGNHLSTLRYDDLGYPTNICVVGDGTILVSGMSDNVLRLDYGGTRILEVVTSLFFIPWPNRIAMCYDRKKSRLIVAGQSPFVRAITCQNQQLERLSSALSTDYNQSYMEKKLPQPEKKKWPLGRITNVDEL